MQLLFALSGLNGVGGKSWRKDARSAPVAALSASFVVVGARNSPSSSSSSSPSPSHTHSSPSGHRHPPVSARLIVWDNLHGNIAELPLPLLQPEPAQQSEETRAKPVPDVDADADAPIPTPVPSLPTGISRDPRFVSAAASTEAEGGETVSIAVLSASSDDAAAPESDDRIALLPGGGALIPLHGALGGRGSGASRVAIGKFDGTEAFASVYDIVAAPASTGGRRRLEKVAKIPGHSDGVVAVGSDGGLLLFEFDIPSRVARLLRVAVDDDGARDGPPVVEFAPPSMPIRAVPPSLGRWCSDMAVIHSPQLSLLPSGDVVLFVAQGIYEYDGRYYPTAVRRIHNGDPLREAWATVVGFTPCKSAIDASGEVLVVMSEGGSVSVLDAQTGRDRSAPDPDDAEALTLAQADAELGNVQDYDAAKKILLRAAPRVWPAPRAPKKGNRARAAAAATAAAADEIVEVVAAGLDSETAAVVTVLRRRRANVSADTAEASSSWHLTWTPAWRVAEVGHADAVAATQPRRDRRAAGGGGDQARTCGLSEGIVRLLAGESWDGRRGVPTLSVSAGQGVLVLMGKTENFLVLDLAELE
ncbi:hypothetical protein DFJ73DRAFT_765265 [Zopfochytrium polystomum]|nr:hypothetical protein DFJ73DRAFT_765265 [Zopfochytrium polystomum]